jgi:hypothetical protein
LLLKFVTFVVLFKTEYIMNLLLTIQIVAQTDVSEQELQTLCDPLVSVFDAACETACHNHGKPVYYRTGELIDAPDSPAMRYVAVLHMSKPRPEALRQLFLSLQPLFDSQLPSCTLQWKTESLDFLP